MTKGDSIRAWRERKGISRETLADLCGVSYAAVSNWELDRHEPHGAAGRILDDLMGGRIAVIPLTEQEETLLDEAVRRGGFKDRTDFLTQILVDVLKGNFTAIESRKIVPLPETKAAEDAGGFKTQG